MKVIRIGGVDDKILTLIPRITPKTGDILSLTLRNELNSEIHTPSFQWSIANSYLAILLSDDDLFYSPNNRFEINLFNDSELIYIGSLLILGDEDVQNYPDIQEEVNIPNKKLKY